MKSHEFGRQFPIFQNAEFVSYNSMVEGAIHRVNKAQATERLTDEQGGIYDLEIHWQPKSVQYKSQFFTPYEPQLGLEMDDWSPEKLRDWKGKLLVPKTFSVLKLGFLNIYIRDRRVRQFGQPKRSAVIWPEIELEFDNQSRFRGHVMEKSAIYGDYRRLSGFKPLLPNRIIDPRFAESDGFEISLPFDEDYLRLIKGRFDLF